jgi:hypothetical protein
VGGGQEQILPESLYCVDFFSLKLFLGERFVLMNGNFWGVKGLTWG